MASYALINDSGTVETIIVADDDFVGSLPEWFAQRWPNVVRVGSGDSPDILVSPGWSWDGSSFSPPTHETDSGSER